MTIESEAIPFQATALRGERLLVLAPHPDDEVIGCGGLLAQHLRERRKVRVVVFTDGGEAAEGATDREAYRTMREDESRRGLRALGGAAPIVEFLRFPDRRLDEHRHDAARHLVRILRDFRPDLITVPSPIEIHPDHEALARLFCEVVQSDPSLFAELALAQVAFYEISQPLRPDTLVDISDVADVKFDAIAAHASQTAIRDYVAFARGLNAYRAMTLPPPARFAEAYSVTGLSSIRTTPLSRLRSLTGDARPIVDESVERVPVSVVIRTRNRPALLREAVESVRRTRYPAEIVVVNDGGSRIELEGVRLVEHEQSRGRSEAMNAGVRAASSPFIAFLDDDDLYYPEHLDTLTRASATPHAGWYTDAVSTSLAPGPSGAYEPRWQQRIFSEDFDRDLLLVDNYVPLPTLLVRRDDFLAAGGFDPAFDLFEDWDFVIRLAQRGDLLHIPRVTCEIRHVESAGSILLASPEGSERFRDAKLQVWKKHAELLTNEVFARAFERQKQRLLQMQAKAVEADGLRHHFDVNIDRLEREKQQLIGEIAGHHQRIRQLEEANAALEKLYAELSSQHASLGSEKQELERRAADLERLLAEAQATVPALYAEIHRLQGLLDSIYSSRTWKLHTVVEKMRMRGRP